MFEKSKEELTKLGAVITTAEIKQQPDLWQGVWEIYQKKEEKIGVFLRIIKERHQKTRVLFTGAGTSAYAGEIVVPYLVEEGDRDFFEFESVPTTSIVASPSVFFQKKQPTLLVSFARSGNSPESLASVRLGRELVEDFYHLIITCAEDGQLATQSQNDKKALLLLMPPQSNDAGFAMTSSFTCMVLMSLLVFDLSTNKKKNTYIKSIQQMARTIIEEEKVIDQLLTLNYNRVVYLGAGAFAGLAKEVQLKILELTAGKVATLYETPLGFRHGPKSFVNSETIVFVFVSNDSYTRKYDLDILKELKLDRISAVTIGIGIQNSDDFISQNFSFKRESQFIPDCYLVLPYALIGQLVALITAVKVGNLPDTPSPTGTVNRVVQGVQIYPFE